MTCILNGFTSDMITFSYKKLIPELKNLTVLCLLIRMSSKLKIMNTVLENTKFENEKEPLLRFIEYNIPILLA